MSLTQGIVLPVDEDIFVYIALPFGVRCGYHASSPGCRAHYYAELAVSSPTVAETIASTHCTYPWRDGQAEWAWEAWVNIGAVVPPKVVTNSSTNRARRNLTSLVWQTPLPLRQYFPTFLTCCPKSHAGVGWSLPPPPITHQWVSKTNSTF